MTRIPDSIRSPAPVDAEQAAADQDKPDERSTLETVRDWASHTRDWVDAKADELSGGAKSAVLSMLDCLPIKQSSPVSTALLKHYVERSGGPFELKEIPADWQQWIVAATHGKVGRFHDLNPYNSGLFDLRNSLGHFEVEVKQNKDGTRTYAISDTYQFGFIEKDTAQRGRHGFPLGELSETELKVLKFALPKDEYTNPGGFREHWEIKTIGKETFLIIPQQFLAEQGRAFPVTGGFTTR